MHHRNGNGKMRTPVEHVAKDGTKTYYVRFREPRGRAGRQRTETFDSRKDALRFAALIEHMTASEALRQMRLEDSGPGGKTLDQLAAGFFEWSAGRHRSDRTVADYRRDYRNWIQPVLGSRSADGIAESDVQDLVDSMRGRLSPKSIADRHAILHGIFNWAVSPGRAHVRHNPCVGTELPKRARPEAKGLRPAEWLALYPALRKIDGDASDLALFMLATGWRISEASALSAYDVEDDGRNVTVTMGRVVRRNAAGEHVIVDDAKSRAGIRRVTLDPDASEMVRGRLEKVRGDGLVFTTAKGSQWHSSNFNNRYWRPAVEAAKLARKPTPHWLRHTAVFWLLLTKKVSLPEIQRRIGHESFSTTNDVYGRMIEDVSLDALDAFEAMRLPQEPQVHQVIHNP